MTIGAFEAKNQLSELLRRVQAGEEIVITKHGQPMARLVAWSGGSSVDEVRKAFSQLKTLRQGTESGRACGKSLSELVHEGHQW